MHDNEKPKTDCSECRQRKPSQTVDKLEEHLKHVSIVTEKTILENSEKHPKTYPKMVDSTDYVNLTLNI